MKPLNHFFDSPSSGKVHFPQKFCIFFMGLVRAVFGLAFRYKAYDLDHIKTQFNNKGFIIAGNHCDYFDPLFVMSVMRPRPVRYLAKEEFFKTNRIVARCAAWLGIIPVKRGSSDMTAIKRSVHMLRRGEILGIFPEGTRIRSADQKVVYHEGVALISALAKAPVVPVRLWNTDKIKPQGSRFFHFPKVVLRFGKPISIEEERFAALPKNERYAAFANEVMRLVYELEFPKTR